MQSSHTSIDPRSNFLTRVFLALALLSLVTVFIPSLRADDTGQPARAIRLSYVDGKVQLAQGDQPIADQAVINTPLLQGMTLSTGDDGKAEIQFEDGSVARIAPNSTLTLTTLAGAGTSAEADLTLERGEAYFELQANGQVGVMRVHFGDSVVTASGFTVIRAQYDTPPGSVAVFSGNAHLERANSTFLDLHSGESLTFNSNGASSYDLAETVASDSWDQWNSDRDQTLSAESAAQTAVPGDLAPNQSSNPAWSDLDANGSWYNVPDQGYVWSPYDASNAGFDPYGNGNWVWMPGFGYTWASGYSWGYLPFSCGAWNFYDNFGWGWAPGFGGCSPWWSIGIYRGPAIGFAPGWYHRVRQPEPPRQGQRWGHPVPMIAVKRNEPGFGSPLPPRDRNTPVSIGGATVIGMRPFPGRTTPRPGIVVRGVTGPTRGGGMTNRPVYTAPRNSYNPPAQSGVRPGSSGTPNPGNIQPPRSGDQQRPGGFSPTPQPGRIYGPPSNRGNIAPYTPSPSPSTPAPAPNPVPRTYTPPPAPSNPQPSRPTPPPGGGYHPSPTPNPGVSDVLLVCLLRAAKL